MAPRDDRDQRKKLTPPAGVQAQIAGDRRAPTASEEWGGETPIDARDPVSVLESRTKRAADASKSAAEYSKAATTSIDMLRQELYHSRTEVQGYVDRDMADHERLFQQVDRLENKFDGVQESISDLRTDSARYNTKVDTMIGLLEEDRKARAEHLRVKLVSEVKVREETQLAEVEVDKKKQLADVEDRRETASFKRKRSLKLWHIVSGIVGLLGTIATVLGASQC